ncbi:MAG TPA: apolipoprotein N-acyltransferase [Noviherbaspirillum sp.]|nr:apolipoprotein N-acyltransferase [Noviherbaspirillum sp.]
MRTRPFPISSSLALPLVALLAGAVNVFAFAPFGLWPLQIATLALAFHLVLAASNARAATLIGWAYGTGWLVTGVHWLYISMNRYGGLPGWMAALAVLALAAGLSLYAGIALGGARWLADRWRFSRPVMLLLALPAAWTLAEWSRGWILTGFPWVSSGYAHSVGPLAGYAPVVGVYGIGWVAAFIAGALLLLPRLRWPAAIAVLLLGGGFALKNVQWTVPHGEPITVRLLQGNVPQDLKFEPRVIDATLTLYNAMITGTPADLIATPETALPMLSSRLPPGYLDNLADFAERTDSHIAVGLPVVLGPGEYANSVLGLGPGAHAEPYRYDKHHLVPFGEFIPLGARWFVNMMEIPLGDFARGRLLQHPFQVRDQWVMPNVCYEDLFGEEIAAQLRAGVRGEMPQATMLLNVSNIAWFGDSIAVPQHLQVSQMRSLETGRPMLRATNTGATAVVGPDGKVQAQLPPFSLGALSAEVQGYAGTTPYILLGNVPVVLLAFLLLAAACLSGRNPRPAAGKNS